MSSSMDNHQQSTSHSDQFCLSNAFYKCFGIWKDESHLVDDDGRRQNKNFLSSAVCCCFCKRKRSSSVKRKQPYLNHHQSDTANNSCISGGHLSDEELCNDLNNSQNSQQESTTCLEDSKAAAFKGVKAFLSINGEVKSKVDQHTQLETTNNEKNSSMTIDSSAIITHEANDNYLPNEKDDDKLKVIYQTHHNIDDVIKSDIIDDEITPLLVKGDDEVIKTTPACKEEEENNKENNSGGTASVSYFRNLVRSERQKLTKPLEYWAPYLDQDEAKCPSHGKDEIRTVIGQTNLVIKERFSQFSRLIDQADRDHEDYKTERPVLMPDLQGFWDMVYFQVEDVTEKFSNLQKLEENGWDRSKTKAITTTTITPTTNTPKAKTTQSKNTRKTNKKPALSEEDRKRREAARKRIADARKAMAQQRKAALRAKHSASDTSVVTLAESNVEIRTSASKSDILMNNDATNDMTSSPSSPVVTSSQLRTIDTTCGVQVTPVEGISQTHESSLVI